MDANPPPKDATAQQFSRAFLALDHPRHDEGCERWAYHRGGDEGEHDGGCGYVDRDETETGLEEDCWEQDEPTTEESQNEEGHERIADHQPLEVRSVVRTGGCGGYGHIGSSFPLVLGFSVGASRIAVRGVQAHGDPGIWRRLGYCTLGWARTPTVSAEGLRRTL